jgi:hypothetical protein
VKPDAVEVDEAAEDTSGLALTIPPCSGKECELFKLGNL